MTYRALTALLCLAALASVASGAIFAIDLGTEFMKVSIVKPGRIPISIVLSEMSKRKTPALVAFINGDRLVGEEAASLVTRYPDRVYAGLKDMLGRPHDDEHLRRVLAEKYLQYRLAPSQNSTSVAVETDTGAVYSAEELVASLLEHAKQLAEAAADGVPTSDCVLTVPSYFTPTQRQALLDGAKLAGLNVMGLIHSHAAAALQYGIERDFSNRTERVVLYDMGSGTVEAALVKFSAYTDKKGATLSQLEVQDVAWMENLGGDNLEVVLMNHFAEEFNRQLGGGKDVRSSPKAMAKLRAQVKRTKLILSANTEAPISVEELFEDRDFRSSITRAKFEELAGDFWERAAKPLEVLLERNNLTAADLAAVELLGGGSRVPRLKAELSKALGGRALDMHLDGDEACVMGAGLFAANLSTTFRLRKFGMADKVPYQIKLRMEGGEAGGEDRVLVPAMKKMPTKRVFSKVNATEDSLAFSLWFDNEQGAVVPTSIHRSRLGRFEVSGIHSVIDKYGESGKTSIHTRVDQGGVFHLEGAECILEVMEPVPEPPPPPPPAANGTAGSNSTEGGAAGNATEPGAGAELSPGAGEGAAGGEAPAPEASKGGDAAEGGAAAGGEATEAAPQPVKMRKRVIKAPLNVTGGFDQPGMTTVQLEASRKVLAELRARDRAKRETARAKNDLESYIIATRDKVGSDEGLALVTTAEQRDAFRAQLDGMEDWLYDEGDAASAKEYREQLAKLKAVGGPMFKRAAEHEARPKAVQRALDFVELARKAANSWPDLKPWLNATDIQALVKKVDEFAGWLTGKVKEQEGKAAHEEPAFGSEEVASTLERVKKAFNRLNNKKKPKPPPAPPAPANATEGAPGNTTEGEGAAPPESGQGEAGGKGQAEGAKEGAQEGPGAEEEPPKQERVHEELR